MVKKTIHYVNIQASLIYNMIDRLIESRRAVNQLDNIILSLTLEQLKCSSGLILTHAMHIIKLAFDNLWQEWITFRDAIHQLGVGKITPYLISVEKLTTVLEEIWDKLPERMKLISAITHDTVHSAYGWILARPTLSDGQLRVFLQIPLKTVQNHFTLFRILFVPEKVPNSFFFCFN